MSDALTLITIPGLSPERAVALEALLEALADPPEAISRDETDEAAALWTLTAYFAEADAATLACDVLAQAGSKAQSHRLAPVDWVRRSLEGLPPVNAGRFQLHGSHDRTLRRWGGIALEIDAGTAFGTGHHGTTAGCLWALDRLMRRARPLSVLDVGTGTGVLALAAAKALRVPVVACDIDGEAVAVTRVNAGRNALSPWVAALRAPGLDHPQIRAGAPYGLIFANILARPLIALAPELSAALARGGHLVLSGITPVQERQVGAAYRNRGLVAIGKHRHGSWSVLVFSR